MTAHSCSNILTLCMLCSEPNAGTTLHPSLTITNPSSNHVIPQPGDPCLFHLLFLNQTFMTFELQEPRGLIYVPELGEMMLPTTHFKKDFMS